MICSDILRRAYGSDRGVLCADISETPRYGEYMDYRIGWQE